MSVPVKLFVGVTITFEPLMPARPLVGLTETMVSGSPSGSLSLASTGTVTATFFGVLAASFTATGGRLVIEVTTGKLVLLAGVGSSVGPPTVAMLVTMTR